MLEANEIKILLFSVSVNWNGELHNMMTQDIFSVIFELLNNQKIIERAGEEEESEEEDDKDED